MPVYPGTETPILEKACTVKNQGFAELKISMYSHVGTHLDVPAHLFENGKTLTQFDVQQFTGRAFVQKFDSEGQLSIDQINRQIDRFGVPEYILFCSGWDKYWGTESYFKNFPVLSVPVCEYLVKLSLKGIGVDAISIDPVESSRLQNHHILLSNQVIIVENLTKLDKVPDTAFDFYCLPLKLENGDGSPVRAIAQYEDIP